MLNPPRVKHDLSPYHDDRANQPHRLPAAVPANIQALYDLGYRHWSDGATKGGHMRDPIYRMGWEAANVEYAQSRHPSFKMPEPETDPFTLARWKAEGIYPNRS